MIQICTLYSLEDIADFYFINKKRQVINVQTGLIKKVWITSNGYPSVSLATKDGGGRNVTMHKLVALAFINNGPYQIIEHIDDNKLDYQSKNLRFSNQKENILSAIRNKKKIIKERTFQLVLKNKKKFIGTMKELSKLTGISRGTLYDHFYHWEKYGEEKGKNNDRVVIKRVFQVK